jgi:hypothetical protein
MMDQLNPKQKPKSMKENISSILTDDLSFFICGWLLNNAVSYTASSGQIINNESERTLKESVMAYIETLS